MSTMRVLVAMCVGLGMYVSVAIAEPDVFSDAGYEADRSFAVENSKLHLVFVRSATCNSSGVLEKRRWVKQEIISWVKAHAVVTMVDINASELRAKALEIQVTPTLIVFRDDKEIGRVHGAWWVDDIVQWLEHLRTGVVLDPEVAAHIQNNQSGTPIVEWFFDRLAGSELQWLESDLPFVLGEEELAIFNRRINEARLAGDVDTEVGYYLWLIRNGDHVFASGINLASVGASSLAIAIQKERLPREKVAFLRDEIEPAGIGVQDIAPQDSFEGPPEILVTWLYLNGALGDYEKIAAWARGWVADDPQTLRNSTLFTNATEAAIRSEDWELLHQLIPDPVSAIVSDAGTAIAGNAFGMMMGEDISPEQRDRFYDAFMWAFDDEFAAILSLDDGGAAEALAIEKLEELLGSSSGWRVVFIFQAAGQKKLAEKHIKWIEEHRLEDRHPMFADGLQYIRENPKEFTGPNH